MLRLMRQRWARQLGTLTLSDDDDLGSLDEVGAAPGSFEGRARELAGLTLRSAREPIQVDLGTQAPPPWVVATRPGTIEAAPAASAASEWPHMLKGPDGATLAPQPPWEQRRAGEHVRLIGGPASLHTRA